MMEKLADLLHMSRTRLDSYLERAKNSHFMLKIGEGLVKGASSYSKYASGDYHYDGMLRVMNNLFKMEKWVPWTDRRGKAEPSP